MTGQDYAAFVAFVHLVDCYGRADDAGRRAVVAAMGFTVAAMQPKVRHVAKAAIPAVLDWGDEDRIWQAIQAGPPEM